MRDKPISFMSAMVRAIQDGRKTMTRRGLKLKGYKVFTEFQPSETIGYDWTFRRKDKGWCDFTNADLLKMLPFQVGDTLWVKEQLKRGSNDEVIYAADNHVHPDANWTWKVKTLPPMFCPRGLSRINLRVTGVKIERLNDISEEDVIAEGVLPVENGFHWLPDKPNAQWATLRYKTAIGAFNGLWEYINGEGSWAANPYIVAYSFERITP